MELSGAAPSETCIQLKKTRKGQMIAAINHQIKPKPVQAISSKDNHLIIKENEIKDAQFTNILCNSK